MGLRQNANVRQHSEASSIPSGMGFAQNQRVEAQPQTFRVPAQSLEAQRRIVGPLPDASKLSSRVLPCPLLKVWGCQANGETKMPLGSTKLSTVERREGRSIQHKRERPRDGPMNVPVASAS